MIKPNAIFILVFVFANISLLAISQTSSTISSIGIDAKVIAPISGTKSSDLDFGTLTRSTEQGVVTINFNESGDVQISASGGVALVSSSTYTAATFSITGENNALFSILLPADNAVSLTRTGGGTMALTGFNHNSDLTLSESGTETFSVGANLNVGANQAIGDYSGSFDVIITYQ